MSTCPDKVLVRAITPKDHKAVLSLIDTAELVTVDAKDFEKRLRKKNTNVFVAVLQETIIGYLVYEVNKDFFHVLHLGVDEQYRRHKVGTALISSLIEQLTATKRRRIVIELRESNLVAQLFLRSARFRCIEILRACYKPEDGYRFEYRPHWPDKVTQGDQKGHFAKVKSE